jgi:HlyD family secretion protein
VVSPGATVAVLLGRGATRLSALVDEKYLGVLTLQQRATVVADALPERPFPAALAWIAPAVDAGRGTVELRFSVAKPPVELRPDQTVSLNVDVTRREATLSLPPSAVRDAAGDAPWALVVAGDRLERRALRLGIRGDDRLEVLAGVTEGEPVVLGARVTLVPGARVRPRVVEAPGG